MGLVDLFRAFFPGGDPDPTEARRRGPPRGVEELARRLGMRATELRAVRPTYHQFVIPKRSGSTRKIAAPLHDLKRAQKLILRKLLQRLPVHPAASGFERGRSIVTNALPHAGKAVLVRMDLHSFFDSIPAARVERYFRAIGWNKEASALLASLTTHGGALPQGAPTSPKLSNLVNHRLDTRLAGLARRLDASYTRYADDLAFSFAVEAPRQVHILIRAVKRIAADEGYRLHEWKKLHIRRRHDRHVVTGLVVNERVSLPRKVRRWLRAVEHHAATGRRVTLTGAQLAGWRALRGMVERQRG